MMGFIQWSPPLTHALKINMSSNTNAECFWLTIKLLRICCYCHTIHKINKYACKYDFKKSLCQTFLLEGDHEWLPNPV